MALILESRELHDTIKDNKLEIVEYLGWRFEVDMGKTTSIYQGIELCGPEICSCAYCLNFISIREKIYPPEFISLLKRLGINFDQEAEVYHINKIDENKHLYGGWFHFVGNIISDNKNIDKSKSINKTNYTSPLINGFEVGFTNKLELVNSEFKKLPVVQLEFITQVPWVLNKNSKT